MITVYQFPPAFGLPVSVSGYCTKLEVYLRLTGREYATAVGDLMKSPNRKVPYVDFGDGKLVAETADIIAQLEAAGPRLDDGLSEVDLGAGRELEAEVQDVVYFAGKFARFADPQGWRHQKASVRAILPPLLAPMLVPLIRHLQRRQCAANGFRDATAYGRAVDVINRVAQVLQDRPFVLGDAPRVADCAVWSNLMHVAYTPSSSPIREATRNQPVLRDYIARVADRANLDLPVLS